MIVGHTACGGCIAAYHAPANPTHPPHNALTRFLDPLVNLRHSLPEGSDVNALIEANVKLGVSNLAKSDVSAKMAPASAVGGGD
jgi:carbonic anhydrase